MISTAVGADRVAGVIGYETKKGFFQESSPNLPMRIAILGQANLDKQTLLNINPQEVTNENQAGQIYGFGSQIHIIMRILRNKFSDGMGGIPTVVYPQPAPTGGAAQSLNVTATGTASKDATITLVINGRRQLDGSSLDVRIAAGDTPTVIHGKMADVINACFACPGTATSAAAQLTFTCKWSGIASTSLDIDVDLNGVDFGVSFGKTNGTAGAGSSSTDIQQSLGLFGNEWNTIVINPYGESEASIFESFNGTPGANQSGSRYAGEIYKPFVCLTGDTGAVNVANEITSLSSTEATLVKCPAPNSKGWPAEAAANWALLLARQAQDSPHLDLAKKVYPDMPIPTDSNIGIYQKYNDRDILVRGGASVVDLINGRYVIQDAVTGYRPEGENPPLFRHVRSLIQDWNIAYGYLLLVKTYVEGKSIAASGQAVRVGDTIKIKQWKKILFTFADDLAERNIIVDPEFMKQSIETGTSLTNPDRLDTFFRYKRSPFARIASTTVEAGFAFGVS